MRTPATDIKDLQGRAISQLTSGRNLPRMEVINEPLVKIVPRGEGVTSYTPFFTKQSTLNNALASGQNLSDYFGLRIKSEGQVYDIYEIKPKGPTQVFINTVAATEELGGLVTKPGGAE